MAAKQRVLGPEHPETLSTINNLAGIYRDEGKYELAEPLLVRVLEVRQHVLGQDHPDALITMNNLGLLYVYQGNYQRAEPLLAKALDVRRRTLGQEHPDTLISTNNLALMYAYEHMDEKAEQLYLQVLDLQRRVLAREHPRRLATMNDLAALYIRTHKYAAAESLLRDALNHLSENSAGTWVRYNCESLLGASLAGQQKFAEAEPLLLSGYQGMLGRKTTIPWERRFALSDGAERIPEFYESWRKPEKAAEWRQNLKVNLADFQ
jgi:tetratricopeptide (TPR) repeat protein